MKIAKALYYFLFLMILGTQLNAQSNDRIEMIEYTLETLILDAPGLDEQTEFTTNDLSLQEFIRGIGLAHNLNVSVANDLNEKVVNNFNDARVLEVFVFLCKTYSLEIEFTSNILFFKRYVAPESIIEYIPNISYDSLANTLSLNLKNDSLSNVIERVTYLSPFTVLMAPELSGKKVTVFIEDRPFEETLDKLALTNNLELSFDEAGYYVFSPEEIEVEKRDNRKLPTELQNAEIRFTIDEFGLISGSAYDLEYTKVIDEVCKLYNINYFLFNDIKGKAHLDVEDIGFESFLTHLFNGSQYTYKNVDNVYLFGNRSIEGLRHTELLRIDNRVVDELLDVIPAELTKDIDIKVLTDLNALVMSGSAIKITELKNIIREIDQVVPMIGIELIIVDVNKSNMFAAGMQMSFGSDNPPPKSTGTSGSGGLNVTANSSSINSLITSLNGFGSLNLGKVTPDFYINLEALESQGYIKTRQKTKLSALNGEDAEISIGDTEYYLEVKNDIIGTQNPVQSQTQNWKSVDADLTVNVKPVVSNDGQVVLEITVTQKDFTARVSPTAPPGNVSRTFKSIIRVRDGDMILLGGLEEKKLSKIAVVFHYLLESL